MEFNNDQWRKEVEMKSSKVIMSIGLFLALAAGCAKTGEKEANNQALESFDELDGTWVQACRAVGAGGSAVYTQATVEINGLESIYMLDSFTSAGCQNDRSTSHKLVFSYGLGAAAVGIVGAQNMDIVVSRVIYIPRSDAVASAYNATAYCGVTNWQKDVEQDVAGRTCDASVVATPGTPFYGVISRSPSAFYFGRTPNGGTGFAPKATDRPTDLDTEPFLLR